MINTSPSRNQTFIPRTATSSAVSADLLSDTRHEPSDTLLVGFQDERIDMLKSYFINGDEIPGFQSQDHLGRGWVKADVDRNPATTDFRLELDSRGDGQTISFDRKEQTITLNTANRRGCDLDSEAMTWHLADDQISRKRNLECVQC